MTWTRRRLLLSRAGGALAVATGDLELVAHGVLPGKQSLNELDGTCSVAEPALSFAPAGPSRSGSFRSAARGRTVGYTIGYPTGHAPGRALPLLISLHGFGGDHASGLGGLSLPRALAARAAKGALGLDHLTAGDGAGASPAPGNSGGPRLDGWATRAGRVLLQGGFARPSARLTTR